MTEAFPSQFVDARTGVVRRFQTAGEMFWGGIMPRVAEASVLGFKALMLAPAMMSGHSFAALAAVGAAGMVLHRVKAVVRAFYGGYLQNDVSYYNSGAPKDAGRLLRRHRRAVVPGMMTRLSRLAGLAGKPALGVITSSRPHEVLWRWNAYASGSMKAPYVLVGDKALGYLGNRELCAILAHEFTHVAVRSRTDAAAGRVLSACNDMGNVLLLGSAVSGVMGPWAAFSLAAGTGAARLALKAVRRRHTEAVCDRGAQLMTGMGEDMVSGLDLIGRGLHAERLERAREAGDLLAALFPDGFGITRGLRALMSHPSHAARVKAVGRFAAAYPGFCAGRGEAFGPDFNGAAAARPPMPPGEMGGSGLADALADIVTATAVAARPGRRPK